MRDQPDERESLAVTELHQQVVQEVRRRLLIVVQHIVLRPSGLLATAPVPAGARCCRTGTGTHSSLRFGPR
eukprot:6464872-Heterocapsa_arctica.AAC.1